MPFYCWMDKEVVNEYDEHARRMLHTQSSSKAQKTKLSSQFSIDEDEHSHRAHDTSMRAELPRWPINGLQRCEHSQITLKNYAKRYVCKTTDEQVFFKHDF